MKDKPKEWGKPFSTALWTYRTSFKISTQFTPFHLVYGQEALLPIKVEVPSLKLLAKIGQEPGQSWESRLISIYKLEETREESTEFYIDQATKKKEKFNKQLRSKEISEGMLVLRYDSHLDNCYDAKFSP